MEFGSHDLMGILSRAHKNIDPLESYLDMFFLMWFLCGPSASTNKEFRFHFILLIKIVHTWINLGKTLNFVQVDYQNSMSNSFHPTDVNGLSMMDPILIFQVEKLSQRPVPKHANVFNTITCTFSQQVSFNGVTRVPKAAPDQTWPSWSAILRQTPGNSYPALHKYKPNRNRP